MAALVIIEKKMHNLEITLAHFSTGCSLPHGHREGLKGGAGGACSPTGRLRVQSALGAHDEKGR